MAASAGQVGLIVQGNAAAAHCHLRIFSGIHHDRKNKARLAAGWSSHPKASRR
jgi:hypothetical protein